MRSWIALLLLACCATARAQAGGETAGYDGNFFIHDSRDWFVLYPKGRLQIDSYNYLNRGDAPAGVASNSTADPRARNTVFIRRARVELLGTMFHHFDFHIAGEWAQLPPAGGYGTVADAYVIVDYLDWLKFQAGQFDAPFSLENRTSDKYFDFMERSLAVRDLGVPLNKEDGAMIFGWLPKRAAYYSLGLFNGDGQNFKNLDDWPAFLARGFVAPLAPLAISERRRWMKDIWVGASFWWQRDSNLGGQAGPSTTGATTGDVPTMTTQGGFTFFSSNYNDGKDLAGNLLRAHLTPQNDTFKWAIEVNVPINRIGVRFEYIGVSMDLAQYFDTQPATGTATRSKPFINGNGGAANLNGFGYYLEAYGWILGDTSYLETPGIEAMPRLRHAPAPEPRWGLMVAARYEHLEFNVIPLKNLDANNVPIVDPAEGRYSVDTFELGVNAWASKHVRLTANYLINYIDGNSQLVKKNLFYQNAEHELLFRVAIAL